MRTITGDLITLAREGTFDVTERGCNCMCLMGAGLAGGDRTLIEAIIGRELAGADVTIVAFSG